MTAVRQTIQDDPGVVDMRHFPTGSGQKAVQSSENVIMNRCFDAPSWRLTASGRRLRDLASQGRSIWSRQGVIQRFAQIAREIKKERDEDNDDEY